MTANKSNQKEKLNHLVSLVKSKKFDQLIYELSYFRGDHGAFYGIAMLYKLTEEEQQDFLQAMQDSLSPENEVVHK